MKKEHRKWVYYFIYLFMAYQVLTLILRKLYINLILLYFVVGIALFIESRRTTNADNNNYKIIFLWGLAIFNKKIRNLCF